MEMSKEEVGKKSQGVPHLLKLRSGWGGDVGSDHYSNVRSAGCAKF